MARASICWTMLIISSAIVSNCAVMPFSDDDASYGDIFDRRSSKHLRHNRRALALAHAAPSDLDSSVTDLEAKAKVASDDLQVSVDEAVHLVKDGAALKHDIAQKGVKVRVDEKKLRKLEAEAGRLAETKDSLFSSLHHMLDAKIELARKRVDKKEAILHRNDEVVQEWKTKAEELKIISKDAIKEKHAVKQSLLEAEAEVTKAKEKEESLRRKFERASREVGEKVQSFEYAEARYQAQVAHKKAAEKAASSAKESLDQLAHTLDEESQKVEQSLEYHKLQLNRKINSVEEDREKSSQELANLKGKFEQWREDQHREKEEIAKKRRDQERASEEVAEQKRQFKQSTKMKAKIPHATYETKGDWDSWGSSAAEPDSISTDSD
mmetsp:Transcript_87974/g.138894  ORF Transcript_87974/g.138894 Transcript_87974/m.138894 type:complete len:381 (-) Transcript_87974:52-1194(-)